MDAMKLIGLNTKYFRYQQKMTQEQLAEKIGFKIAYLSLIETGNANLTCKNIDLIAHTLKVKTEQLFNEKTAKIAKTLPA